MKSNPNSNPSSRPVTQDDIKPLTKAGLQSFAENVWIADGPEVLDMGIMFTTRMVVVRLSDGSVWVNSPVPASFETLSRITALGPIRYLVAATPRHVWRLDGWHTLFPDAQLWAPRASPFTLKKGRLPFTGILSETPKQGWVDDFDQLAFKGSPLLEEVIFFHKESRTLILDDLIQTHSMAKGRPLQNVLVRLSGVASPHGGVGIDIRMSFTNRGLARRSLEKLLSWDFDKLIIAHGPCVETNAKPFVERAFQWLGH